MNSYKSYPRFEHTSETRELESVLLKRYPELVRCEFIVRAPGRVNIIGEHTDYNGYSVLPMAIEQAIYLAAAFIHSETSTIGISSESDHLESYDATTKKALQFAEKGPPKQSKWYHYVLCGVQAIYEYAKENNKEWNPPSIRFLLSHGEKDSYLTASAGLSSSSACVVAAAMATMRCCKLEIDKASLADVCARSERLIGTQGGGMDQTACLLADRAALLINFGGTNMSIIPVSLPRHVTFVIADSGVRYNKGLTSKFNQRVSECREAAHCLLENPPYPEEVNGLDMNKCRLYDAQKAWRMLEPGMMVDKSSPLSNILGDPSVDILAARAWHVFTEAQRVLEFQKCCSKEALTNGYCEEDDDIVQKGTDCTQQMGELMNASQNSCQKFYECSCQEIDKLVKLCREYGALGSRLTGAGWGGCVISLIESYKVQSFIENIAREFYSESPELITHKIFATEPGRSAGFIETSLN